MDIDGQPKNVIDSYLSGNASHYLNHSCYPNIVVFGVFYDSVDPSFHRLAFFTKRNVAAGEELTLDPMWVTWRLHQGDSLVTANRMVAKNGYIYSCMLYH